MSNYNLRLVYSSDTIEHEVRRLGGEISRDYRGLFPLIVGVLKGGFIFLSDLVRNLDIEHEVGFVLASSYKAYRIPTGMDLSDCLDISPENRHVLLVDEITDTGSTVKTIYDHLWAQKPLTLKVCVFINKLERRQSELRPHYIGFSAGEGFLVGYGMDYNERYRHLPNIYVLDE